MTGDGDAEYRLLGTVMLIAEWHGLIEPERRFTNSRGHDIIIAYLVLGGSATILRGTVTERCGAGDALVADLGRRWSAVVDDEFRCSVLILPRRTLARVLPDTAAAFRMPAGPELEPVWRLVRSLLDLAPPDLSQAQATLAGEALRHLLTAVLVPTLLHPPSPTLARDATLLERLVTLVDARLTQCLTVATLCSELGCSRSALYRAAAPVNGIAELVVARRLIAVHRRLAAPAETRTINAIAEEHGFGDAAQFSRQFKRMFGITAGRARLNSRTTVPAGPGATAAALPHAITDHLLQLERFS